MRFLWVELDGKIMGRFLVFERCKRLSYWQVMKQIDLFQSCELVLNGMNRWLVN